MLTQPTSHQETAFVFQAYGKEELYQQVILSILTLHYCLKGDFTNARCVIYTDKPAAFSVLKDIPLSIELLTKENIATYKGEYSFVHRLKICVLRDAFVKYKANLLYLDGDTYFMKSPKEILDTISQDVSLMHTKEYDMYEAGNYEDHSWLAIRKTLRQHEFIIDEILEKIPFSSTMWNAGVLGIAYENAYLMNNILSLSDQLYEKGRFFSAEQFAFSTILQKNSTVFPMEDIVFHYWNNNGKLLFNHHLKLFFRENRYSDIDKLSSNAWDLVQRHHTLAMPKVSKLDTLVSRLKLTAKVIILGHV